jgi:iron complex outermembrane recepter protein
LNDRLGADFTVSGNYQSHLAFDIVRNPPEALAGGYFLLNAEAGVSPGDHWRVWIWGQNLCDRLYKTQAIYSSVGWGYSYGAPRTYGINLSYKL